MNVGENGIIIAVRKTNFHSRVQLFVYISFVQMKHHLSLTMTRHSNLYAHESAMISTTKLPQIYLHFPHRALA